MTGIVALLVAAIITLSLAATPRAGPLRVCADPNNLPFSNQRQEGFENRIADLLARDLGTSVSYTWWAQRRGFLRNTLDAGRCDVVMGVPTAMELAAVTQPYYRSTYVFVTRATRHLRISGFDDPVLRSLRIGVQLIGDDGANSPPAHALSRRGIVSNLVGFSVYGDYRSENPPSAIIAAVADGAIDVAAAWGPMAGFFAMRQRERLSIVPVSPAADGAFPQTFAMSLAVRRGDQARRARLNALLTTRRHEIDAILAKFHVPRVDR